MAPISSDPDHISPPPPPPPPPPPSSSSSSTTTTFSSSSSPPQTPANPSSILIIGAGVFGLSTALALATRPEIPPTTTITVIDRSPDPGVFPARDASSIDSSRIIRADYADPAYAALAADAQAIWRQQDRPDDLGAQGRYTEAGLLLVGNNDDDDEDDTNTTPPKNGEEKKKKNKKKKKAGLDYVRASFTNVQALHPSSPKITALPTRDAIRTAYGTGGATGAWGYLNGLSGWADAEASMAWLYARARATQRITFVNGTVATLLPAGSGSASASTTTVVRGVQLASGATHTADLTILATGAWTPSLIPLEGRAIATGQVLAYVPITPAEQAKLANLPTLLNMSTGYFIITPAAGTLKIARHAYGYLNPVATRSGKTVSVPVTHLTHDTAVRKGENLVPLVEQAAMRDALREMVPWPELAERPFSSTRLCWYTDTPDGDFIIDYHPERKGLFVATGASGHGFKFLPVIGDKIVDCVLGKCPDAFKGKWNFKPVDEGKAWDGVVTEDGSRGGLPGLILSEELKGAKTSRL
ncbi:unnamed protein product [Discula destructiva]